MDTQRFRIGDAVIVKATIEGGYDTYPKNERKLIRTELRESRLGQLVGLTRIQLGKYRQGSYDEESHLEVKATATVWLVRFGMLNQPVRVLDEDISLFWHVSSPLNVPFELPLLYMKRTPWREEWRKELAKIMETVPRDKKGRWMKC